MVEVAPTFNPADMPEVVLTFPGGRKVVFCRDELVSAMASLERFTEIVLKNEDFIYCSDARDFRSGMVGGTRRQVPALAD